MRKVLMPTAGYHRDEEPIDSPVGGVHATSFGRTTLRKSLR
jgi:hypothetical protein